MTEVDKQMDRAMMEVNALSNIAKAQGDLPTMCSAKTYTRFRMETTVAPRPAPRYERIDIPHQFRDLAERRTQFLFHVMTWGDQSMRTVLASAYLQGINDAVDAVDNKAKREAKEPPTPLPWHC